MIRFERLQTGSHSPLAIVVDCQAILTGALEFRTARNQMGRLVNREFAGNVFVQSRRRPIEHVKPPGMVLLTERPHG